MLFAYPTSVPCEWLAEQCRLARSPGYLEAHLTALRALVGPFGQREVLVDRLSLLETPTLVVWGERDRVFPRFQAKRLVACLWEGSLALIPNCGHMPHVECPDLFLGTLDSFLLPKKARGYVGNVQEQGSRGKHYTRAGQKPSLAARQQGY